MAKWQSTINQANDELGAASKLSYTIRSSAITETDFPLESYSWSGSGLIPTRFIYIETLRRCVGSISPCRRKGFVIIVVYG